MLFDGLTLPTILIAAGAMTVGCAFQAAVGLGFALVAAPILALVDPQFVPGPLLLAGAALAAIMAHNERAAIDRPLLSVCLVGLAAGTIIGTVALQAFGGADLQRVFGGMILLAVGISMAGVPVAANLRNLLAASAVSGIMGVMAGIHGPAIALAFQRSDPKFARAMLGGYFTVAYLLAAAALYMIGAFGMPELGRTLILLPGVAIGLALAPITRRYVDRERLRVAILSIAAISALLLIVK